MASTTPEGGTEELLALADRVLAWAGDDEQVEVVVGHSRETEVRAFDGEVESFVASESRGVGIRVLQGIRQGFAWAGSHDPDIVAETFAEARDNARFATEDPFVDLARPDGVVPVGLELRDRRLDAVSTEAKIALALELEARVRGGDPRMVGVESADYADAVSTAAIVSTTGIRSVESDSACSLSAYSLASDGAETTTGFGVSVGRSVEDLDLDAAVGDAVERAVRLLGAGRHATGRLTVVLDPWVTAQLLSVLAETFSGMEVLRGRSWVADRVGERVAPEWVSIADRPTDPTWMGAASVDDEGLATRTVPLIDGGVVSGFVHDAYSGRASGAASTGSAVRAGHRSTPTAGVRAVVLEPGTASPADILAEVGTGLYVSEVQGMHSGVNPISGDFSTGVEGLVIRGGELAEPIRETTIASTLPRMLAAIRSVGGDLTALPLDAAGVTLAIDDVSVSGS